MSARSVLRENTYPGEAAFKPGRDGMAEALRVNDARFAVRRVMHPEPRDCVIVTFGEIIG